VTACGHDLSIRWQKAPHPCGISIKTSWQDDCTTNRWQDNYAFLVVDDEPAIRSYIKVLLQREGFDTPEAAWGKVALQIVKMFNGCVDLIVTDVQMPDI
jgi:PleD family two-component response regulator